MRPACGVYGTIIVRVRSSSTRSASRRTSTSGARGGFRRSLPGLYQTSAPCSLEPPCG